jgi:hypothetical protein
MPHHGKDGGPMKFGGKVIAVVAALGLMVTPLSPLNNADVLTVQAASPPDTGMPDQSSLDNSTDPNVGNWTNMQGGLASRPYVTKLSVINNGVSTDIITDGKPTADLNVPVGRVAVAIAPFNLCRTGQQPTQGVCYSTPNRIGVSVGFQTLSPTAQNPIGQLGYDFANTGSTQLLTAVNENTEFDITLNLNTLGKTLRWTWANGIPTYWNTANLGQENATLRIRLKPTYQPIVISGGQQVGCSQVPVEACQYTQNTHEALSANLVLSLDTTNDPIFTGALFASSRSYMGSLLTVPSQPGVPPQLTYGVSAPLTWSDGTQNVSQMTAVLSDAAILNFFGATPEVAATTEFASAALALQRTDGGSSGTPTWTRWTAASQGTDGWLVTIPEIRFAAAAASSGVQTMANAVAPASFKVKTRTTVKIQRKNVGKSMTLTVTAKARTCKRSTCRIVVRSISSKYGTSGRNVKTVNIAKKSQSVTATIAIKNGSKQSLSVMVQSKKSGKWAYVASGVTTP